VVDDAVNLAGKAGKKSARGFVNAVLRGISRRRHDLPLPPRPASEDRAAALDYLSITLSHPRWLAARWLDRLGFEAAEKWERFNNAAAPLTLRANRLKTTRAELTASLRDAGVKTHPGAFAPDALLVDAGHPLRTELAERGAFAVQDEASQLVTLLAGAAPGRWTLDTCASPGGKAAAIAATLSPGDRLVACDVRARRVELLRRTIAAAGAGNILVVQADIEQPLPFSRVFDCVIVDAPCSGLGTLRRDPDIRWRRQESDLPALAAAERRMLANAAAGVARGGRLVYATCSSEPEENEDVAAAFLAEAADFEAVDARTAHPALPPSVVDERGHLRTDPARHGLEAFFGAVFRKR
jgi:16S rRNA (cytosine967-C5)-methyltransferase